MKEITRHDPPPRPVGALKLIEDAAVTDANPEGRLVIWNITVTPVVGPKPVLVIVVGAIAALQHFPCDA
jgi:hypothetical protein